MSIKVLVISDYRNYHTTRPEASIFIGLAGLGFKITVMTYGKARLVPEFEKAGIEVIDFHPEKKFSRKEIRFIRDYLIMEKPDIAHFFNSPSTINGIRAARGLPVKVVLYRGYVGNIHWYDPTAYLKFLNPRVDKIFCNSQGVEDQIKSQLFFDKSKTITINKGHDLSWYDDYKPAGIRKDLGIPSDSFLLIHVSYNRKMKGINFLLEAFNLLPEDAPVHLLLVGTNMDTHENLEIIEKGGRKDRVHILGYRGDVLNIVADSDVFVLSSIFGESITKAVIEAMALGIPPVITDIPGNKELVIDGESGLVARAGDSKDLSEKILRLARDRELCKKIGTNARKRIETDLNTKQTIIKTKEMYEDLLS
jgi:glycosyltransferase involved in cell wall biosynthesis